MAAAVVRRPGLRQVTGRQPPTVLGGRLAPPAGSLGECPQELAARSEGVGDPLIAVDRRRGPELAGDLGDDQLAGRDRGLIDLGEVGDRRTVAGPGAPDRDREALRQAPELGRGVDEAFEPSAAVCAINLVFCVVASYNLRHD
jgi:hypothetical protein